MITVRLACDPSREDQLTALLWELGTTGIAAEPGGVRAFFDVPPPLEALAAYDPRLEILEDIDWVARTQASFPPLEIGGRFFLAPEWSRQPTPPGLLRLVVTPGQACGTGWHPCTQLCLEALARFLKPGASFLDVGAGSGILCEAARLLGAAHIAGCDIDPEAIAAARAAFPFPLFLGSAGAVASNAFDLVAANISADAALDLLPDLHRVAGTVIVSGFQEFPDAPAPTVRLARDGWQCLVFHGSDPSSCG